MSPARIRLAVVLAGIAVAGLVLLAWTQPWFVLELDGRTPLTVSGQAAAQALSALALASLALVGALSIAGRGVRVALGIVQVAIGAAIVATSAGALAAPVVASAAVITETTAVGGPESLAALVTGIAVTPWPWVSVVAGALTTLTGIAVLATGRRWPGPTRKYETAAADEAATPVGAWDTLSDGADPTR